MSCAFEAYVPCLSVAGRARLGAGAWRSWSLADGTYLFGLLVDGLESAIGSAHADLAALRLSIDSTGQVVASVASGGNVEIEWPADLWLSEVLGYGTATTVATSAGAVAPRPATHRAQLDLEAIADPPRFEALASRIEADERLVVLQHAPPVERTTIELDVAGWHRSGELDDWHRLRAFFSGAVASGARVRYYPDTNETGAYALVTNEDGYREGIVEDSTWSPRARDARMLGRYRVSLTLRWL